MAYREFRQAKPIEPPVVDTHHTLQVLELLQQEKMRRQERDAQYQDNLKFEEGNAYFPNIQKQVHENILDATNLQQRHIMSGGRGLSPAARQKMASAQGLAKMGASLKEQYSNIEQDITGREKDPYYQGNEAREKLKQANKLGTPEEIQEHLNNLDTEGTYDVDKMASDYVAKIGKQTTENKNTGKSGIEVGTFHEGKFFTPQGTPGITDEHVKDFLKFHPKVSEQLYERAHTQVMDEIAKAKAANDVWQDTRNLPTADLINGGKPFNVRDRKESELFVDVYENPGVNPHGPQVKSVDENGNPVETPKTFGTRTFEEGKNLLAKYEDKHNKAEINAGNYNADKARGITSSKYTVADDFDPNMYGGPGRVLVNKSPAGDKNGILIPIKGQVYSKNTKELVNKTGDMQMFATSYNSILADKEGRPISDQWNNVDQQIDYINKLPADQVKNIDVKTVVHGQAYNKLELNKARGILESLKLKANRTEEENKKITEMQSALDAIGADPDIAPELVEKALGVTVDDVIKTVDNPTAAQIEGKLGEFNILAPKNQTADQRRLINAVEKRKKEVGPQVNQSPAKKPSKVKNITAEDFNSKWATLKSGESLIGPDGKEYTKK